MLSSLLSGSSFATQVLVAVTAYSSTRGQTDSTPFITATGTKTKLGTVAISRDLVRQFGYGKNVVVKQWIDSPGCNEKMIPKNITFKTEDTMHARWNRKIDIWLPSVSSAMKFGTCYALVNIY